jgi:hypothetical protein
MRAKSGAPALSWRNQRRILSTARRLRTRLRAPKAITAMARKLACLFYRLIKHGQPHVDKETEYYEARYREQQILADQNGRKSLAFNCLFRRLRKISDGVFRVS